MKTKTKEQNPITKVVCIIELKNEEGKKDINIKTIELVINAYSKYYVMIIHDKDKDEEGKYKRPHAHILMHLKIRQRPLTLIKKLSEDLKIEIVRLSIRPLRNEQLATQYMLHMNNPEKTPYLFNELITNDEERTLDNLTDNNEIENLTSAKLIRIIKETTDKIQILRKIGLKNYNRYIRIIDMIIDERTFNYRFINEIIEEELVRCADPIKKN